MFVFMSVLVDFSQTCSSTENKQPSNWRYLPFVCLLLDRHESVASPGVISQAQGRI